MGNWTGYYIVDGTSKLEVHTVLKSTKQCRAVETLPFEMFLVAASDEAVAELKDWYCITNIEEEAGGIIK